MLRTLSNGRLNGGRSISGRLHRSRYHGRGDGADTRQGRYVLVWNRTRAKAKILAVAGADVALESADVFAHCATVFLMLVDRRAMDTVLDRGGAAFADRVTGRTIVHMGTTSPAYSRELEADIRCVGGNYVEAPVSGSRKPAEAGQLVAMLAGDADAIANGRPLLTPMCRKTMIYGPVPNALLMKLSINLFLISLVTASPKPCILPTATASTLINLWQF